VRPAGRYVIGLVLIAVMAAASFGVTYRSLARQEGDAATLQLAAGQGRTARQLADTVVDATAGNDRALTEIRRLRDELVADRHRLLEGDASQGVPAPDDPGVVSALEAVSSSFDDLVAATDEVVAALEAGEAPSADTVGRLTAAAGLFDVGMGSAVFQAQVAAERRVARLKQTQYLLLSAMLLTLIFEGLFLFRPAARRLRTMWDERDRELDPVRLSYLARYDPLTGLINRTLFTDRLEGAIARTRRDGGLVAVMFLDVDDFKEVNDRHGHDAGDAVLRQVAERLVASVRESDTVARLAGDEFTVILEGIHRVEDAGRVATKVLTALRRPYDLGEAEVQVTTSIGVAVFPVDGQTPDELVKAADLAMYAAKAAGRNTYQYFTRELRARTTARMAMIDELRRAIEAGDRLRLVYLPVVDATDGSVTAMEALLRWNHPELGPLSPSEFVPLAEETDLVLPMADWVFERACRDMRRWQTAGLGGFRVAVNVSDRRLREGDLIETVDRALGLAGLDPRSLQIEFAESAFGVELEVVVRVLQRLRERGVLAFVDDFGTAVAPVGMLARLPLAGVKIDQSLIERLKQTETMLTVSGIIALVTRLERQVVAEGVETDEQRRLLVELGCTRLQGFAISAPLEPDEVPGFLASRAEVQIR